MPYEVVVHQPINVHGTIRHVPSPTCSADYLIIPFKNIFSGNFVQVIIVFGLNDKFVINILFFIRYSPVFVPHSCTSG